MNQKKAKLLRRQTHGSIVTLQTARTSGRDKHGNIVWVEQSAHPVGSWRRNYQDNKHRYLKTGEMP